jgi:hypothetical protein
MFNLENIRVIHFLRLTEEQLAPYTNLQKIMNPVGEFCGIKAKPLGTLTFGQVKNMERKMAAPTFEDLAETFNLVFGVSKHQLLRAWVTDFFYAVNWIQKSLMKIIENEKKVLGGEIDAAFIEAGIERLAPLRELPILFDIGRQFGKDPEEIENWKYNKVFAIQAEGKIVGDIQKEYQRIKNKSA